MKIERAKLSEEQYEDRISNLPNSLIAQILSRLPTKYAVSTSVLSTRWIQMWTSIDSFDIDDELLLCRQNESDDPLLQRSFTSFVSRVLLHQVSCVQRFRLKCSTPCYDPSLVNGWIANTLLRNVRELDLDLYIGRMEHSSMLPRGIFTCTTLAVLKLAIYGYMINVPTSVSLPSLRILHLSEIRFVDDDSINGFLFGCPLLEELSMDDCVGGNIKVVNIVAPMLTSLFMHDCLVAEVPPQGFRRKIVLDTPALLHLTITDSLQHGCYVVENVHHLIEANIHLYDDMYDPHMSKAQSDILKGISHGEVLEFGFWLEDIYNRDGQLPKFPNMTCLKLGAIDIEWTKFLPELLENSPHLETLVFKEGLGVGYDRDVNWNPARNVPSCLLFHLKEVGISKFNGLKKEWEIVNYFLKNAKVLEEVNIDYGYGGSKWTIHPSRT